MKWLNIKAIKKITPGILLLMMLLFAGLSNKRKSL